MANILFVSSSVWHCQTWIIKTSKDVQVNMVYNEELTRVLKKNAFNALETTKVFWSRGSSNTVYSVFTKYFSSNVWLCYFDPKCVVVLSIFHQHTFITTWFVIIYDDQNINIRFELYICPRWMMQYSWDNCSIQWFSQLRKNMCRDKIETYVFESSFENICS